MKSSHLLYKPHDFFPSLRGDAEVDNLLNNDVYKFLMMDFILANPKYWNLKVRWKMTVRNPEINLASVIPMDKLIKQFQMTQDAIQGITPAQASYLRGLTKSDRSPLLREETIRHLEDFRLPKFSITRNGRNYDIKFEWSWPDSMMWEILWLKIINTMYLSEYIKKENISDVEFTQMITSTLGRLFEDIKTLKSCPEAKFSEFGTRRAMSTEYQRLVNEILNKELPGQYMGTSNVMFASEMWSSNPIGTNAHELRMIPTALYDHPDHIIDEMYDVDRAWARHFPELAILLPDTYGTSFYLENCPRDIREKHTGIRFDSKDPMVWIPEYLTWCETYDIDPKTKVWIPSDGLTAQKIVDYTNNFWDKLMLLTHGMWTNLSNNTKWTWPRPVEPHGPYGSMSVVIKPAAVLREDLWKWVECVKLSDNPGKAIGWERISLFQDTFWTDWMTEQKIFV